MSDGYREVAQDSDSEYNAPDHAAAAPREVSGEAAPNNETWSIATTEELLAANAAAPTPRSDSLDLEAIRAVLDGTTADTVDRGGILWLLSTCAALLSRLETLTRERDEAQEKFRRLGEAYNFLYHEHGALSGKFLRLESENARMAEVVEAARSLVNGYNSKRNQSRAGTVAQLRAYLADFDAARASRTQSRDANPETKQ